MEPYTLTIDKAITSSMPYNPSSRWMISCKGSDNNPFSASSSSSIPVTGIELDELAEKGLLSEPLQDIIHRDEGLYGIDEVIALSIVNVYGSIGSTSYVYVD